MELTRRSNAVASAFRVQRRERSLVRSLFLPRLFLRGYHMGVRGRSLGMTLTMMPTVLGYALVLILIAISLF